MNGAVARPAAGALALDFAGIAAEMGIDPGEIEVRKRFLELTQEDADYLRTIRDRLAAAQHGFADGFYRYLRQFPELAALLPDDAAVARLKAAHGHYFARLTEGSYDRSYIHDRLRVGLTHQRLSLESALRRAVGRGQLELHYQPQVRPAAGSLPASRHCCAGATPSAGWWRRACSFRSRKSPA